MQMSQDYFSLVNCIVGFFKFLSVLPFPDSFQFKGITNEYRILDPSFQEVFLVATLTAPSSRPMTTWCLFSARARGRGPPTGRASTSSPSTTGTSRPGTAGTPLTPRDPAQIRAAPAPTRAPAALLTSTSTSARWRRPSGGST